MPFVPSYGNVQPITRIANPGSDLEISFMGGPLDVIVTEALTVTFTDKVALSMQYLDLRDGDLHTVTWPVDIDWGSAGAPTLTGEDTFIFYCVLDTAGTGTEVRGIQLLAGGWD